MDDKFKKDLIEILDQQFEKKFIKLFNQGVDEVLIPQFEDIDKEFININNKMTQGFDNINNRLDNLAIKIDAITSKQLDDEYQVKNHEKRINKLESHRAVA